MQEAQQLSMQKAKLMAAQVAPAQTAPAVSEAARQINIDEKAAARKRKIDEKAAAHTEKEAADLLASGFEVLIPTLLTIMSTSGDSDNPLRLSVLTLLKRLSSWLARILPRVVVLKPSSSESDVPIVELDQTRLSFHFPDEHDRYSALLVKRRGPDPCGAECEAIGAPVQGAPSDARAAEGTPPLGPSTSLSTILFARWCAAAFQIGSPSLDGPLIPESFSFLGWITRSTAIQMVKQANEFKNMSSHMRGLAIPPDMYESVGIPDFPNGRLERTAVLIPNLGIHKKFGYTWKPARRLVPQP